MKTSNVHNLPEAFRTFQEKNAHTTGGAEISITSLIDSPQIFQLRNKHNDEITEDIGDNIMSILGTAVHEVLRQGAPEGSIVEERIFTTIDDMKISGQVDLQTFTDNGVIVSDYKTCSTNTLLYNPNGKQDWIAQLNGYAELVRQKGYEVCGLEVIAIFRDWTRAGLRRSERYPAAPVVKIPILAWPQEKAIQYLKERIRLHRSPTPDCSQAERWESPERFAVHAGQGKRARRVFDTVGEATNFMASESANGNKTQFRIETRRSESTRCKENYCGVKDFCPQFRRISRNIP